MKTLTKGDVIVEEIEVGDIHYEFEYGFFIKSKVITKPVLSEGVYTWKSINVLTGGTIDYLVNTTAPSCYAVNLYTSEVYGGCKQI